MTEEYREIGVMKAIGITDFKIRSLYLVKYLMLAVVGAAIGFLASIPFGNMLLQSVTENMMLGNSHAITVNFMGAVIVIAVTIWFAYRCTGKVKKLTPVDAIRNGQSGELFKKKSIYRLGKSRFNSTWYLAVNDILSSPRRFLTIILSFFLCSVFMLGVVITTDTMKSKNLITTFGKESDVYISDVSQAMGNMAGNTRADLAKELDGIIMPTLTYGYKSKPLSGGGPLFPGTIDLNGKTVIDLVYDILMELIKDGFTKIFIMNAHFENEAFVVEAMDLVNRDTHGVATIIESNWWAPMPEDVIDKVFDEVPFPGWAFEEIDNALDLITVNGAKTMHIQDEYGLEEGKPANFIVLEAKSEFDAVCERAGILASVRNGEYLLKKEPQVIQTDIEILK